MPDLSTKPRAHWTRPLLVTALVAALLLVIVYLPVWQWLDAAERWNGAHPIAGPGAFIAASVAAAVLFVPGSLIAMSAGYLFGFLPGIGLGLVAVSAGALAALLAGRLLVRGWAESRIAASARLRALDRAVEDRALLLATLTRLALVIPFNLLNYVFGATAIRKWPYFIGTVVGMVPATLLYVYLGTLAKNFEDIRSGRLEDDLPGGFILGFGLVVVTILVIIVQRAASRALRAELDE